jgi:transposase-like protein
VGPIESWTPNHEDIQMAKARRKRHTYTPAQRTSILGAARREGLTALQVKQKFGVAPVTYYSWRKKTGLTRSRGTSPGLLVGRTGALNRQVRQEVRAKVRQILPVIVRSEVSGYLASLFGGTRGRPRKV